MSSHYEVLELERNASIPEIKKAYYRLAKRYHPDKGATDDASKEMFQKITDAYAILSNESERQLYDMTMGPAEGSPWGPVDDDLFEILNEIMKSPPVSRETLEKAEKLKNYKPSSSSFIDLNKYLKIRRTKGAREQTKTIQYKRRTYNERNEVISTQVETLEIPLYLGDLNIKGKGHVLQLSEQERRIHGIGQETVCGNLIITIKI